MADAREIVDKIQGYLVLPSLAVSPTQGKLRVLF